MTVFGHPVLFDCLEEMSRHCVSEVSDAVAHNPNLSLDNALDSLPCDNFIQIQQDVRS